MTDQQKLIQALKDARNSVGAAYNVRLEVGYDLLAETLAGFLDQLGGEIEKQIAIADRLDADTRQRERDVRIGRAAWEGVFAPYEPTDEEFEVMGRCAREAVEAES